MKVSINDIVNYKHGITPIIYVLKSKFEENNWWSFFKARLDDKTIDKLDKYLVKESGNVYPLPIDIFNAFLQTPLKNIKVVIIGQDPYQTKGAAMGLAFSHNDNFGKIQPSLQNIYKELVSCGYKVNEKSGNLMKWANEGVFLINTALTVKEGQSNSHSKVWTSFTENLFQYISRNCNHIVVIMWGNNAQTFESLFNKSKHEILKCAHPSPYSVSGFFGNKHFVLANGKLKSWGIKEIDWNL